MRERLGTSLRYVADQVRGELEVPDLEPILARLAAGPVDVQAFGAYYDLVLAIEIDDPAEAEGRLQEIAAAPARAPGVRVWACQGPEQPASDRYRRFVNTDPGMPFEIVAPPPGALESNRAAIDAAFALLERGAPALAAEIRALLQEIVIASAPPGPDVNEFDGASCFMLWGGIVLNAASRGTTLEMVQALAHESAHNLLFGFATDGPLVENDDADRFDSPLRYDPRPMDGIYHATFVTARMHHAVHTLLAADVLEPDARTEARTALETHTKAFESGLAVIEEHGRLTATGANALELARAYMTERADRG